MIGTFVGVDVCVGDLDIVDVENALIDVWGRFAQIEERMSAYDSASYIGRINDAQGAFVEDVPFDVYKILEESVKYAEMTEGSFDITVRPLIDLWQEAEEEGRIPTEEEIAVVKGRSGVERIKFGGGHKSGVAVDFIVACDGCKLDLGGIAKGYAVDEAAEILRSKGIKNFLIDAGGDMYAGGKNCSGRNWRIGVNHPRKEGQLIDVFEISDQAVTTSGDYAQYYEIEGEVFSHIIDPVTGYPQKGVVSATVFAPTAMEADVFSTTLMVQDPKWGIDFIDGLGENYGAMIISQDEAQQLKMHYSTVYSQKESFKVLDSGYIKK